MNWHLWHGNPPPRGSRVLWKRGDDGAAQQITVGDENPLWNIYNVYWCFLDEAPKERNDNWDKLAAVMARNIQRENPGMTPEQAARQAESFVRQARQLERKDQ